MTTRDIARLENASEWCHTGVVILAELHHLHEAEPDDGRLGVVAVAGALDDASAHRHHVLQGQQQQRGVVYLAHAHTNFLTDSLTGPVCNITM